MPKPLRPLFPDLSKALMILGATLLVFVLYYFRIVDFQELRTLDWRFQIRPEQKPSQEIVIVEIDDTSVKALGTWPWPRSIHAAFLQALGKYDPRLIVYDVLFTEASYDQKEDEKLSYAIEKSGRVILPFYYYSETPFQGFLPIPSFRDSARAIGFVNTKIDYDGVTRRVKIFLDSPDQNLFSLPAVAALDAFVEEEKAQSWLNDLPMDSNQNLWVNFPGPLSVFPRLSFGKVIKSLETPEEESVRKMLKDKIILVGHTVTGGADFRATPFSPHEPAIAIHASVLHTLLSKKYITYVPWIVELGVLIFLAFFVVGAMRALPPSQAMMVVIGFTGFYFLSNLGLFFWRGWVLPWNLALIVLAGTTIFMLFFEYIDVRFRGELLGRELETAARIQASFLPKEPPVSDHFEVAFYSKFAKQVGGDFFDWMGQEKEKLGVCIGDVSGKGVPAALYLARFLSDLRREIQPFLDPGTLCTRLNQLLCKEKISGMFLTLSLLSFDSEKQVLNFCSAGHEPFIHHDGHTGRTKLITDSSGGPLGLFPEAQYGNFQIPFKKGDMAILFTDGLKEAKNRKRQEYGYHHALTLVKDYSGHKISGLIHDIQEDVSAFTKQMPLSDDQTIVGIRAL